MNFVWTHSVKKIRIILAYPNEQNMGLYILYVNIKICLDGVKITSKSQIIHIL